jgi:hypothetical protein
MIGFMLDSARALDQRSYYPRFIDFIADRGADTLLMHFSDDQGCALRFNTFPESASANAYTHDQMRELAAYAKSRGITLIPELASLGHTRYLTHNNSRYAHLAETDEWFSSLCPVSPEARELVAALLDEVLGVFESPIIHVGLDEVNLGKHPLTRKALQTQTEGQIFADYVCFLHARLTRSGRRMMMWGDYVVHNPTIVPLIPRDILIANWQYDPDVTADATRQLADNGFDVVSCPALISHNQPIYPGESFAYPNLSKMASYRDLSERVVGMITTIWTPTRFLSDTLWPAVDYALAVMQCGPQVAVQDRAASLGREYFGLSDSTAFARVMVKLADHIPRRSVWLAVLQLQHKSLTSSALRESEFQAFQEISQTLHSNQRLVTSNRDAYERLLLLCDLLVHCWERAIAIRHSKVSPKLVEASVLIAQRLAEAWDTERFANDPRKITPATAFDVGDHLLVTFQIGTEVLRLACK